jgi:hypothetical protein
MHAAVDAEYERVGSAPDDRLYNRFLLVVCTSPARRTDDAAC